MESKVFVEINPKLAERKLELQKLQLNFIRNGNNKKRIEEQEQVLELLYAHP